jgi:secretion/DNA translocation related TadE-like protein
VKDEGGSVSVVLAAGVVVALVLTLGIVDVGVALVARSRARTAADAAALAAAQELAFPSGGDPAILAGQYASVNGSELVSCQCATGTTEAIVEVRVEVRDLFLFPGPHEAVGRARAVVDLPSMPPA